VRSRSCSRLSYRVLRHESPPGTNYVGSMVVFEDGLAKKIDYRHFNVKECSATTTWAPWKSRATPTELLGRRAKRHQVPPRRSDHRRRWSAATARRPEGGATLASRTRSSSRRSPSARSCCTTGFESADRVGARLGVALSGPARARRGHRFAITFHRSKRGKSMVASSLSGVEVWAPRGVNACSAPSAHSTRCVRRRSMNSRRSRGCRRRGAKALRSSAGASPTKPTKGSDDE